MNDNFRIHNATWLHDKNNLKAIRRKVFIEEQAVPESMEWDEHDADSHHVLVYNTDDQAIACARLKKDGQIGRIAVLPDYRQHGIGAAILNHIIQHASEHGNGILFLHAQSHAVEFYERFGFRIQGDEFEEAGILHYKMYLNL